MKILVTGSTGFIGRHLVKRLVEEGYEPFGFDLYTPRHGLPTKYPTLYGDVRSYRSAVKALEKVKPDAIIHLAAIATRGDFNYTNFDVMLDTIIMGTANVCEAAQHVLGKDLERFIYTSSSEVYGNQTRFPIVEKAKTQPLGPYCIGKIGGELYVKYMMKTWDFPAVILRPFNTIGAMRRRTVVESVVWQMMEGGTLKLGDPASIRDFLWIQDHVNSYLKCLENDKSIGEVFNLCTGRGVSIENLVKIASEITGWNGQVLWNQFKPRINDIYCLIGSYGKAERMLGWKPTVTLEEAIKRMYEAWRK